MSIRILWRSAVFIFTLLLIYILFPIFLVPSKLPAIQSSDLPPDAQIFQLQIPQEPTLSETINNLRERHRQGMKIILAPVLP